MLLLMTGFQTLHVYTDALRYLEIPGQNTTNLVATLVAAVGLKRSNLLNLRTQFDVTVDDWFSRVRCIGRCSP